MAARRDDSLDSVIKAVSEAVERGRQSNIALINRRLNQMSPADVGYLARLLSA